MRFRGLVTAATVFVVAASLATAVRAKDGKDGDKDKDKAAAQEVIVDFGAAGQAGAANHFLVPDEAFVTKGGTVVFRVNGGGHGVSIYRVSRNTVRDDIQMGLCAARTGCSAAQIAENHVIRDGDGHVVVESGTDPPFQRLDDADRILVGTAAQATGEDPGRFHNGAPIPATPTLAGQSSERIRIKFLKNGRYLAICMNRAHSVNDWMFGFINVTGDKDDDDPQ
jgi:hypothetical protein